VVRNRSVGRVMAVSVLAAELEGLCTDRPMGAGARAELARLLEVGTDDEIRDVLAHLQALARWHFPYLPKLSDEDVDRVHVLIDGCVDAHLRAVEDHRRRLRDVAAQLAAEVQVHRLTITEAEARLDSLANRVDAHFPIPRALVQWDAARGLIREAFAEVLG